MYMYMYMYTKRCQRVAPTAKVDHWSRRTGTLSKRDRAKQAARGVQVGEGIT